MYFLTLSVERVAKIYSLYDVLTDKQPLTQISGSKWFWSIRACRQRQFTSFLTKKKKYHMFPPHF